MSSQVILKALGLNFQPNQLDVPPGSLITASNCIIRRDDIVETRRGFKLYGNSFGISSDRAKQLFSYKLAILRHYSNTLQFDSDGQGNFLSFSGDFTEAQVGLRTKSIEANGNLYLTSSTGIRKISATSSTEFSTNVGYITQAGGVKATDISAVLTAPLGGQTGFLQADAAVGYRVLWLTKDVNGNLIEGTPSSEIFVYNPITGLMLPDYINLASQLDNLNTTGSIIKYGQFVQNYGINANSSASELQTQLLSLGSQLDYQTEYASNAAATAQVPLQISSVALDNSLNLATVTFSGSPTLSNYFKIGDNIFLTSTSSTANNTPIDGFTLSNANTKIFNSSSVAAVDITLNTITISSHGFITGQPVQFTPSSGTLPTGINQGQTYYIINPSTNTFQLSLTKNGSVLDITALGSDTSTSVYVIPTGNINGQQIITNIGSTTIKFSTTATGTVSIASSKIISYEFENINNTIGTNQPSSLNDLNITIPATNQQLNVIEDTLNRYILELQSLPIGVVSSTLQTNFLAPLQLTTTSNVTLTISIPTEAQNPNYFFQIYRSSQVIATGTENVFSLTPNDELQLVYEAYPTATEIIAKQVIVLDQTPDVFRGANLYTNAFSGEGIAQANDVPPFALDINRFKGSIFYANTKTKHRQQIQLLGVNNLITDFNNGIIPKFLISNGITTNVYNFQLGINQIQQIVADSYVNTTDHGFIILYSANNLSKYFFRLNKTTPSGNPSGFISGNILVDIDISDLIGGTNTQLAQRLCNKINVELNDFSAVIDNTFNFKINITNSDEGISTAGSVNSLGGAWAISTTIAGNGENAAIKQVLLANLTSPAQSVDATARSLVNVINKNLGDIVYAYYISGTDTTPGQILLESRILNSTPFYLMVNDTNVGAAFSPDLSPSTINITAFTTTNGGDITTASPHGLTVGEKIVILETGTISTPNWNGLQTVTSITDSLNFQVGITTIAGTTGVFIPASEAIFSSDEEKKNRVYYSKKDQPEAVPIINFFDIGSLDKAILRIFPLRDSLFVFKEDGLYRISGEQIPFIVSLFDGSCILEAPDSVSLSNNIIYCWTSQGISTVSESGVKYNISRPIDTDILKKATKQYTNFKTATWGIGYESDNSYLLSTIVDTTDIVAKIMYRYSTLTNTWTTFDKTTTCGVVNASGDDKMYLGAGDTNFIEQERKNYLRTDYADREFIVNLANNSYFGKKLNLSTFGIAIGDVITQDQYVTKFLFNSLLQKLDNDPGMPLANFFSTLAMIPGGDSHTSLVNLSIKLDTEFGTGTLYQSLVSGSTDFISIKNSFNSIIAQLNLQAILAFKNYTPINNITTFEVIVTSINSATNTVMVNLALDFIVGAMIVYKAINSQLVYSPTTLGDALNLKHFRESTIMFENKAFTNAILSFATDLVPSFKDIPFFGDGNGIFGHSSFFGSGFFGGASNGAPMRTIIPRDSQRCRYIVVKFSHNIARENYALYGISLTGDISSTRAYR